MYQNGFYAFFNYLLSMFQVNYFWSFVDDVKFVEGSTRMGFAFDLD